MLEKLFDLLKQPLVRIGILILFLAVLGLLGWGVQQTQASPPQPFDFPHNLHVGLGVQCLYCHPGAWTGESPGLPGNDKCWACHDQLTKYADGSVPLPESLLILKDHVERNEPVPWVPVAIMPDFVYFSHRPHIAAGLNCEACHGNVAEMTIAENPQVMNMGWCLECHREQAKDDPEKLTKLISCETCHK